MTAPLVDRLEALLASEVSHVNRAIFVAQIACYEARIGEFEAADRKRIQLRQEFGRGTSQQVSILIMFLEALLLYYRDLDPKARDWLARANLLSVSFRESALTALSHSWLAHLDFNLGRYLQMAEAAARCIENLSHDDGSARCRVSLVLGDAFAFAGREVESRRWYESARVSANSLGDQAAIGALTYNRAALHVSSARLKALNSDVRPEALALLGAEVRSAVNYQAVARLLSLDHLLRSSKIGVLMLENRLDEASKEISELLAADAVPSGSAELSILLADKALCLSAAGQTESAREAATGALALPIATFGPDDRALIHGALEKYCRAVGDDSAAAAHGSAWRESIAEHQATIDELIKLLEPFAADI